MVILDTCVLIDHIRSRKNNVKFISALETILRVIPIESTCISILTIQEIFSGKSATNIKEFNKINQLLEKFTVIPYDKRIALLAAKISREMNVKPEFVDIALAATAIDNNYELYTLNKKHFKSIANLQLLNL